MATWRAHLAVLACGVAVAALLSPSAAATAVRPIVHPRFERLTNVTRMLVNGRYALLGSGPWEGVATAETLIDERTRARTVISGWGSRPCQPAAIGGTSLALNCAVALDPSPSMQIKLLDLITGKIRLLDRETCIDTRGDCLAPIAVGARWLERVDTCYEHCGDTHTFQNIATGTVRGDPSNERTIPDLNSPGLSRRVCAPLRVPQRILNTEYVLGGWGSVTFVGRFGLVYGAADTNTPTDELDRCGSAKRLRVGTDINTFPGGYCIPSLCGPVINADAVLWTSRPREISGYLLPSERPISIGLPAAAGKITQIGLSDRALYVLDDNGRVWRTPTSTLPGSPRPARHRRR